MSKNSFYKSMSNHLKIENKSAQLFHSINDLSIKLDMPVYIVGGYVRDLLLGFDNKDIDFIVIGDALEFAKKFKNQYKGGAFVTYPKYGTCSLNYNEYQLEFVSAREEAYEKDSRKPTVNSADLYSDLSRRDFTINSMAIDIRDKSFTSIIDPYSGLKDLKNGIIRTPKAPSQTFFDDPLRMMRAIRFATQFSFNIEAKTFESIQKNAFRLEIVSQERITAEFNKILLSKKPSTGILLLDKSNLLDKFFSELLQTKGTEQREEYHHKDVFYHTLQVLDKIAQLKSDLNIRLAALFHDIAKPATKRFDKINGWTFHGHEVVGERMTESILKRLKYPNSIVDYVKKLVRLHLRPMVLVSDEVTDSAIRRLLFLAGDDFEDLMQLCRADITSKNPEKVRKHLENYAIVLEKAKLVEKRDQLRSFKSPIGGCEIMNLFDLKPGPQIGKIKKFIEEAILDGKIANEHDQALKYLQDNIESLLTN
jgi:poly(A) polymerase